MKQTNFKSKLSLIFISLILASVLFSCSDNQTISTIEEENLFSLNYGKYEDELQLFNLENLTTINTKIFMKDGFFFISDDNGKKIMQLTSYGDLSGIIYNPETNPEPSFVRKLESSYESTGEEKRTTTQTAEKHMFNSQSCLAIDSNKNIYIVDQIPEERQEQDLENKLTLKEVVLRFTNDGKFIDYIGQQGPGGTPFPYVKDLFLTKNNEIVVVCLTNTGYTVFWFSESGFRKYIVPISTETIPLPEEDTESEFFITIDKIVPDYTNAKLYIKTDYHKSIIDEESNVQSGIEYYQTLLHPLNLQTEEYEEALIIPPYEDVVTDGFTKLTYKTAFDFLGVTESGWLFFMSPDDSGYIVQMIQPNGQKIIKRHIDYDRNKTVYHNFALSDTGIISALLATKECANVVWWRTDALIESIIK